MPLPRMKYGVSEQDVLHAVDTMQPWARGIFESFWPAYINEFQAKIAKLEESLQEEAKRRRVCEDSLTRCVNELECARREIYDLQMRD